MQVPIFVTLVAASCSVASAEVERNRQRTCGAKALAACTSHLGFALSPELLANSMPNAGDDSSLSELAAIARKNEFAARGVQWTAEIPAGACPAIIPVAVSGNRRHFVAVLESRGDCVLVRDAGHDVWIFTADLRRRGWDGTALHITRDEA